MSKRDARREFTYQVHKAARKIYEAGELAERERIIALLEVDCFCQAPEDQHPCWPCQTIALIKGENYE